MARQVITGNEVQSPIFTDITVVVDRSGSMASIKDESEDGLNQFITQQKAQEGECLFSLVQFDDAYEVVHAGVPIHEVGEFELRPRGSTALLDAVGRAVDDTGKRLSEMPEDQRPGLVVFVIVTDGQENASRQYTKARIKSMIELQREVYKWQFVFLGANQDAFAEGGAMGFTSETIANYSGEKSSMAYSLTSAKLCGLRSRAEKEFAWSDGERKELE